MTDTPLPLALTMGDPAGVGTEITLKAWLNNSDQAPSDQVPFFLIDDPERVKALAAQLDLDVRVSAVSSPSEAKSVFSRALPVLPISIPSTVTLGTPDTANAPAIINSIKQAVELTQKGHAAAVVTNPIAKEVLYGANFKYPGHTEFLAHLGGDVSPVMMLDCEQLRVVLATVHVSILDAARSLNTDTICNVARITHSALKRDFGISDPVIAVAGLNPHAGEGGAMGREEIDIILPAIKRLQAEGLQVTGPHPPDTMFTPMARGAYDVALCMYHDQGLIPLKTLDFDGGVNTTLGLPFVRTSPDHGTAFDIAGTGKASPRSLIQAINMAAQMSQARITSRG